MFPLTTYLASALSATIGTADQLYTTAGTPSTTNRGTTLGTALGYGQLIAVGGSGWAAGGSIGAQNGKGWVADGTFLEGQTLAAGSYSATVTLQAVQSGTPAGTLVADIIVRISKYNGGTYTTIVTMTLAGQTINSTATAFNLSGSTGSSTNFVTADKIYVDVWANVTTNANGNVNQGIRVSKISTDSTTFTGDPGASIATPGYSQVENVSEFASGSEATALTTKTYQIVATSEFASGSEAPSMLMISLANASEFAHGSEIVSVFQEVASAPGAQMTAFDLAYQYARIMDSNVGPQLQLLATTYYGNATNNQAIYGELDALMSYEQIAQLHAMRTANDVTAFLKAYSYAASVLADKPVTYHRAGEAGGVNAFDASGRNMTGTINGGVTLGQAGALAQSTDTAMLFDGSSGYIALPAGVKSDNWNGLTVELWLKLTSGTFASNRRMIANSHSSVDNLGFEFFVNANGVNGALSIGNGAAQASATFSQTFAAGVWYHVVGTYDGTTIKLYVNGVLNGSSGTVAGPIATTPYAINIGRNPAYTGDYFPGSLDEIALYNKALTAARILAHYNAGTNP